MQHGRGRRHLRENSASSGPRKKENSTSSRALKTSAAEMVLRPALVVLSLALICSVRPSAGWKPRMQGGEWTGAYCAAR